MLLVLALLLTDGTLTFGIGFFFELILLHVLFATLGDNRVNLEVLWKMKVVNLDDSWRC